MEQNYINKNLEPNHDSINLSELFRVIFDGKWIILSITAFFSIASVIYSLNLPDIYKSQAILAPVEQSGSMSGVMQNYSGLAGLAGISLPSAENGNNSAKAMEKVSSLSFFEKNLLPNIFLPELLAIDSWNREYNKIEFKKNIYNKDDNTWNNNYFKSEAGPSPQEAFKEFQKLVGISKDKDTGFVKISVKHQSPHVAKKWVELIVQEVNSFYRQKDKKEAEKAVNYVNAQMSKTTFAEIKL